MNRVLWCAAAAVACVSGLVANPMPLEEYRAGAGLVPARAVPVDVLHEWLSVTITPTPPRDVPGVLSAALTGWYDSVVTARYSLSSDADTIVPIVFPFTGEASDVRFQLNGRRVEARQLSALAILRPYAATWRRTVESAIAADERLRAAVAESRSFGARQLAGAVPTVTQPNLVWSAARRLAGGWLNQRGFGDLDEELACFVAGPPYFHAQPDPEWGLRELGLLRRLAVALDPQVPDPLALAEAVAGGADPAVGFAVAYLVLRRGGNDLEVSFRQPLGTDNRQAAPPANGATETYFPVAMPTFAYIVRTARHWRSFRALDVSVRLPSGTRKVECSEPRASIRLDQRPPVVSWSAKGAPSSDIRLVFGPEGFGHPLPEAFPNRLPELGPRWQPWPEPDAPRVRLPLRWTRFVGDPWDYTGAGPSIDGDRVLACSGSTGVVCDLADGTVRAELAFPSTVGAALLHGDRVVVAADPQVLGAGWQPGVRTRVRAYDLGGKLCWETEVPSDQREPFVHLLVRGDLLLSWCQRGAVAVRLSDGTELWRRKAWLVDVAPCQAATDAADGNLFYAAYRTDGGPTADASPDAVHWWQTHAGPLEVAAWRAADAQPVWTWQGQGLSAVLRRDPRAGLLAVIAGGIEGGAWRFVGLAPADGKQLWERELPSRGYDPPNGGEDLGYQPPIVSYAGLNWLTVVAYDEAGRPARASMSPYDSQRRAGVARSGSRCYVPTDLGLHCLDLDSGHTLWRAWGANLEDAAVAAADGRLAAYVSGPGLLSVFDEPQPGAPPLPDPSPAVCGSVPADLLAALRKAPER